ncbi:MAG: PAS domain S-box protein, partial [Acetobacteraceae bacterium]|nr:PAS domain S-box protein [Acetobacteraceae bacterium]
MVVRIPENAAPEPPATDQAVPAASRPQGSQGAAAGERGRSRASPRATHGEDGPAAHPSPAAPARHEREAERLAALARYGVLDTPREQGFDDIAELASEICGAPIAAVNLVADGRQWFKAEVGLGVRETPLETSFCGHAILEEDFMLVPDAARDPRFQRNPLVVGAPGLRFYAGPLLKTGEGFPIGTLCVLDHRPRTLTEQQIRALKRLAQQVMSRLEQRRTEAALRESEARFRHMADSAPALIWMTDAEGRVAFANMHFGHMFGRPAAAMLGDGWREVVLAEDVDSFHAAFLAAFEARRPFRAEVRVRDKGGGVRWLRCEGVPRLDDAQRFLGYTGCNLDITDAKAAEAALRESEERFRNMADHAPVMMWV